MVFNGSLLSESKSAMMEDNVTKDHHLAARDERCARQLRQYAKDQMGHVLLKLLGMKKLLVQKCWTLFKRNYKVFHRIFVTVDDI